MAGINRPRAKIMVDPATGRLELEWDAFFAALLNAVNAVSQGSRVQTKSYTVAGVPSAADNTGQIIFVSDESGGPTIAFSNGTNWLRVIDGATIS